MRQIVFTQGVGTSPALPLDIHGRPEISLQIAPVGGAIYTIQQTLDNPFTTPPASITWLDHDDAELVGQALAKQGNYAFVPAAVRVVVTGGGSAKLTIIQSGITG